MREERGEVVLNEEYQLIGGTGALPASIILAGLPCRIVVTA